MKAVVRIKKLRRGAVMPRYMTAGAAAADICACLDTPVTVNPGDRISIPTGLAIELPADTAGFVYPRSGLASKNGISLSNCVGVIDSDYRGELMIALINQSGNDFEITPGMRIAQLVVAPVLETEFMDAQEEVLSETGRGAGGFGSTGTER
ncbi:MAG: dUTP diphosphatase [Oscillospiraceae bacterium]|nr:dUTP diphosphatase [Oscillospiraceae bacterium]